MKPDPNQFNKLKSLINTTPLQTPQRTAFDATDVIRGPEQMVKKFSGDFKQPNYTPVS